MFQCLFVVQRCETPVSDECDVENQNLYLWQFYKPHPVRTLYIWLVKANERPSLTVWVSFIFTCFSSGGSHAFKHFQRWQRSGSREWLGSPSTHQHCCTVTDQRMLWIIRRMLCFMSVGQCVRVSNNNQSCLLENLFEDWLSFETVSAAAGLFHQYSLDSSADQQFIPGFWIMLNIIITVTSAYSLMLLLWYWQSILKLHKCSKEIFKWKLKHDYLHVVQTIIIVVLENVRPSDQTKSQSGSGHQWTDTDFIICV